VNTHRFRGGHGIFIFPDDFSTIHGAFEVPGRANLAAMDRVPTNPDGNGPEPEAPLDPEAALSPFRVLEWRRLTQAERLDRAWALRAGCSPVRETVKTGTPS